MTLSHKWKTTLGRKLWAQNGIADQDTFRLMVPGQGHLQVAKVMKTKHLRDVNDANDSGS